MRKSELRRIIREEIRAINEGGKLRKKALTPTDAARFLKRYKQLLGTHNAPGYSGTQVVIHKMVQLNTPDDINKIDGYDDDGWLFKVGPRTRSIKGEFLDWCTEHDISLGDWLVAFKAPELGRGFMVAVYDPSYGISVSNTDIF